MLFDSGVCLPFITGNELNWRKYVFALSHMFFHYKAWMKNEIFERMNEKINHLHSFAHFFRALSKFSRLFHNFPASFPQKEQKHTLQQLEHSWRWPLAKEPPPGTSCPQAGLFIPRAFFNYVLTTTKKSKIKPRKIETERENFKTFSLKKITKSYIRVLTAFMTLNKTNSEVFFDKNSIEHNWIAFHLLVLKINDIIWQITFLSLFLFKNFFWKRLLWTGWLNRCKPKGSCERKELIWLI